MCENVINDRDIKKMKNQLKAYSSRRKQIETMQKRGRFRLNFFMSLWPKKHHLLITPLAFCTYQANAKQKQFQKEIEKTETTL